LGVESLGIGVIWEIQAPEGRLSSMEGSKHDDDDLAKKKSAIVFLAYLAAKKYDAALFRCPLTRTGSESYPTTLIRQGGSLPWHLTIV
jgi:hypothetical protein